MPAPHDLRLFKSSSLASAWCLAGRNKSVEGAAKDAGGTVYASLGGGSQQQEQNWGSWGEIRAGCLMARLWGLKAALWAAGGQAQRVPRWYTCHPFRLGVGMPLFIEPGEKVRGAEENPNSTVPKFCCPIASPGQARVVGTPSEASYLQGCAGEVWEEPWGVRLSPKPRLPSPGEMAEPMTLQSNTTRVSWHFELLLIPAWAFLQGPHGRTWGQFLGKSR